MAKLPVFSAPQTKAPGAFDWFVYGSSLDFDAFAAWTKEHGYRLPDLASAKPARLPGWRIAFNVRSNFWGGVVASLVPDAGGVVEGITIPMEAEGLALVRHKEGVLSGLFEEKDATLDGKPVKLYAAAPVRTVPEERPAPRFLETLIKGAKDRGLSKGWVAKLEAMR